MKPLILAHRGYSQIGPENTDLAFQNAIEFEFDGVELDLHLTKDGELVIIHDETITRTSDRIGNVKNMTLAQLRKANFAFKFSKKLPKETIMTYEEFLERFHDKFKMINVELKTDKNPYKGIEEKVLEVHEKIDPQAQIVYSSFNMNTLLRMRKLSPDLELGFLFKKMKDLLSNIYKVNQICNFINPFYKLLFVNKNWQIFHDLSFPMNVWSFDKRKIKGLNKGSKEDFYDVYKFKNVYSLITNSKFKTY